MVDHGTRTTRRVPPYLFPYLIDSPEDMMIEERAWLAHELAATPGEAAREMYCRWTEDHGKEALRFDRDRMRFVCTRTVYEQAWITDSFDEEDEQERLATVDDMERSDEIWFRKCEPDDDGAQLWWVCDLVPVGWRPHHWLADQLRRLLLWWHAYHYAPKFVALNQATWASGNRRDGPIAAQERADLLRRARWIWKLQNWLP